MSPLNASVPESLVNSIKTFGVQHPPLVQQLNGQKLYTLLSGKKRIQAVGQLGYQSIACQVLAPATTLVQALSLKILHDQLGTKNSPIEQALVLKKAQEQLTEPETLGLLSLMGIKPNKYKLRELLDLLSLDSSAISGLHNGSIALQTGKKLARLSLENQAQVVHLICNYRLGGTKQKKLVELLTELILRLNISPAQILKDCNIAVLKDKDQANKPQQAAALLAFLTEQCYPQKALAESRFEQYVQDLKLPTQARVKHTPSFEDDKVELCLQFSNRDILTSTWEQFKLQFPKRNLNT